MSLSKLFVVFLGVLLVAGAGGLLLSAESGAKGKSFKDKFVTNKELKDLILMLKDQIDNLPETEPCAVPPTWGGVIPGDERFVPTFVDGEGVTHAYCDRQTGNVWDAAPEFFEGDNRPTWNSARDYCANNRTAPWLGQKGGRLPTIAELASLVDTDSDLCTGGGPCLPDGHPFGDHVHSAFYWSASTRAVTPANAWFVNFGFGDLGGDGKGGKEQAWCVRGAMDADAY